MKNLFLAVIAMFMMGAINAQTGIGAKAGLLIGMAKAEAGGVSATASETGFYAGVFKGFPMGEGFEIEPGVNAVLIDGNFGLQIPVMAKYFVAEGFNLQAGPQLLFDFEDRGEDGTGLNLGLAVGAGYDISEQLLVEARFGLQLNDYYTGDADVSSKMNTLNLGVGYRF